MKGKQAAAVDAGAGPLDAAEVDMTKGGRFRKVTATLALQMDRPFRVQTKEGVMVGKAGDWLAEGAHGERYPIDAAIFADTYVPAASGAPNGSRVYAALGYEVQFQHGPREEKGRNGCRVDELLRLCMVRLDQLNAGAGACREFSLSLTHLETALLWLQRRTQRRVEQGVSGTNKPHTNAYQLVESPMAVST